jgi:hypothetical protein
MAAQSNQKTMESLAAITDMLQSLNQKNLLKSDKTLSMQNRFNVSTAI